MTGESRGEEEGKYLKSIKRALVVAPRKVAATTVGIASKQFKTHKYHRTMMSTYIFYVHHEGILRLSFVPSPSHVHCWLYPWHTNGDAPFLLLADFFLFGALLWSLFIVRRSFFSLFPCGILFLITNSLNVF